MTSPTRPAVYRVFPTREGTGGLRVAVFAGEHGAAGDRQARAAAAGVPLSAFIEHQDTGSVALEVYTPAGRAEQEDAGSVAALTFLGAQGGLSDVLDVRVGGVERSAQLCGGEWLLLADTVQVQAAAVSFLHGHRPNPPAWLASAGLDSGGRRHLTVQVDEIGALELDPDAALALARAHAAATLSVFALGGPGRADVRFRVFSAKGGWEAAASPEAFAGLTGVLGVAGLLAPDASVIRGHQETQAGAARFTAQWTALSGNAASVWVGGTAVSEQP